jgi:hypothetical protein
MRAVSPVNIIPADLIILISGTTNEATHDICSVFLSLLLSYIKIVFSAPRSAEHPQTSMLFPLEERTFVYKHKRSEKSKTTWKKSRLHTQ